MTKRKGGIGRHSGKKRSSNKKSSATKYVCSCSLTNKIRDDNCHQYEAKVEQDKCTNKDDVKVVGWKLNRSIQARDKKIKKLQLDNRNLSKEAAKVENLRNVCHSKIESIRRRCANDVVCLTEKIKEVKKNNKIALKKENISNEANLEKQRIKFDYKISQQCLQNDAIIKATNDKWVSIGIKTKKRQTEINKYFESRIDKERSNKRIALDNQKKASTKRLSDEKERHSTLVNSILEKNTNVVKNINTKCFESIARERGKRIDIVNLIMKKTSRQIVKNNLSNQKKMEKHNATCNKKESDLLQLVHSESKRNDAKLKGERMKCKETILRERELRVKAISYSNEKLKQSKEKIKKSKNEYTKARHDANLEKNVFNRTIRQASKRCITAESLAKTRLFKMRANEDKYNSLLDEYLNVKEECQSSCGVGVSKMLQFKKERKIGRRGGSSKWPIPVVQIVIEQLVNGSPPTSIRCNIASFVALLMPTSDITELPGLSFIRECRVAINIIGETLTAYRLANATKWEQAFTDGTSRRQISLQNLVIALLDDETMKPLILSSSIISEDETSENQVNAILSKVRLYCMLSFLYYIYICQN